MGLVTTRAHYQIRVRNGAHHDAVRFGQGRQTSLLAGVGKGLLPQPYGDV